MSLAKARLGYSRRERELFVAAGTKPGRSFGKGIRV